MLGSPTWENGSGCWNGACTGPSIWSASVLGWLSWPLISSWWPKELPWNPTVDRMSIFNTDTIKQWSINCFRQASWHTGKVQEGKDNFSMVLGKHVCIGNIIQSELGGNTSGLTPRVPLNLAGTNTSAMGCGTVMFDRLRSVVTVWWWWSCLVFLRLWQRPQFFPNRCLQDICSLHLFLSSSRSFRMVPAILAALSSILKNISAPEEGLDSVVCSDAAQNWGLSIGVQGVSVG